MPSREPSEIDAVQQKVVDVFHRIVCVVGLVILPVDWLRVRSFGDEKHLLIPLSAVGLLLLTYAFRRRLPWMVRSWIILSGCALAGQTAMLRNGLAAPAGILVPTGIVVAWLIWSRWQAALFTVLDLLGLLGVALKNIRSGSSIDHVLPTVNRSPYFWLNLSVIYLAVGVVILGVVLVLFGSFRDALARAQQGERESKADKERLAGILSGIHDAVFLLDPVTIRVLEVHGRVQGIYGFEPGVIVERGIEAISAGESPWTMVDARRWAERCRDEGPQNFPWRAKRADGTLFWVEVSLKMVSIQEVERILVTVRDIDESMRAHQDLEALNASLEQRVAARTAEIERSRREMEIFSYSVSHDLRAPLRAIDGFARILKEDHLETLPPDGIKAVDRIVAGAGRMSRLIDALLGLSQLDHRPFAPQSVDVRQLVEEVRQEILDSLTGDPTREPVPVYRWEIGELPTAVLDPELARRVFSNLIGNACKFSRMAVGPTVRISTIERTDGIWYEISDNGCGFDMAYADKLFKVFHRLHGDSIEGIGIGLATVKKVIDRVGGEIEAEGRVGEGATFRFRLAGPTTETV